MKNKFTNLILDVDGVLTTGQFLYTEKGKYAKVFGPHDNDGIKLLRKFINISAITADKRGYKISHKRVAVDMKLKLDLVTEGDRLVWMKKNFDLSKTIYMGDGIYDAEIFDHVGYGIAPSNAFILAQKKADFVTLSKSGEGAVAEACLHVLGKFFKG